MSELRAFMFKAKPDHLERWKAHARSRGKTLSGLIRYLLDADMGIVQISDLVYVPGEPADLPPPMQIAKELSQAVRATVQGKCENRVPKGSFCKRCGKIH